METNKENFITIFRKLVLKRGNKYLNDSFNELQTISDIQRCMKLNEYYFYKLGENIHLVIKDKILVIEFDLVKKEMLEILFECLSYTDFNDIDELDGNFLYFPLGSEKSLIEYSLNNYFK